MRAPTLACALTDSGAQLVTDDSLAIRSRECVGGLLSGALSVDYLGHAATIASKAPIYSLQCARDMERLDEVAGVITNWHQG